MRIHHWFIPSKKNKFHPTALRPIGLSIFLVLFIAIPFLYNVTSAQQFRVLGYATNVTVSDVYTLSNQERINVGLPALSLNSQLNNAALAKANDMFAKDYWAHVAPDGTTPWSFILAAGYNYQAAGENLAKGFNTSSGVVAGWMGSQAHKDNVLSTSYVDVGYAVVNGVLLGSETTLVVAMYGAPMAPAVASEPASPPTTTKTSTTAAPTSTQQPQAPEPQAPVETATEPSAQQQPAAENNTPAADQPQQQPASDATGVVEGIASIFTLQTYKSLNWGQKTSIVLISTLILLFLMKHTLIWRQQRRGVQHIWLRAHPIGQASLLAVVFVVTVLSGAGTIL